MPRKVTVVRCPKCGSTDAEDIGGMYEFARMHCATCKHEELADHYQIKDYWNLEIELADWETELPAFVAVHHDG